MLFPHAQDLKQPEFLLSPFHQKAVGVNEKHYGEHGHDHAAKHQNKCHGAASPHMGKARIHRQGRDNIIHHHGADAGQKIRNRDG